MCRVTDHAVKRTKERVGISKRIAEKNAEKALEFGIRHSETTGSLNKYISALYFKQHTANNMRVYCGNVYVFCGNVLVTIIPLPAKYRKIAEKIKRKREDVKEQSDDVDD